MRTKKFLVFSALAFVFLLSFLVSVMINWQSYQRQAKDLLIEAANVKANGDAASQGTTEYFQNLTASAQTAKYKLMSRPAPLGASSIRSDAIVAAKKMELFAQDALPYSEYLNKIEPVIKSWQSTLRTSNEKLETGNVGEFHDAVGRGIDAVLPELSKIKAPPNIVSHHDKLTKLYSALDDWEDRAAEPVGDDIVRKLTPDWQKYKLYQYVTGQHAVSPITEELDNYERLKDLIQQFLSINKDIISIYDEIGNIAKQEMRPPLDVKQLMMSGSF